MTNRVQQAEAIVELAQKLKEIDEWLYSCPFDDAQPYMETAHREQEPMVIKLMQLAQKFGDQDILESLAAFAENGELPEQMEDTTEFWQMIANMASYEATRRQK